MADILGFPYGDRPGDRYDATPCDVTPTECNPNEPVHRNPLPREMILGGACQLIAGDRHIQHGEARINLSNIGCLLSAFERIVNPECSFAVKSALQLALIKIARTQTGCHNIDDYVDACGYLALAGELAQNEQAVS